MTPTDFESLINLIGPKIEKNATYRAAVPVGGSLAVRMRYLATGDSHTALQYLFKISKHAIGKNIPEALSFRSFFPSSLFNAFIVLLCACWIPGHRLSVNALRYFTPLKITTKKGGI
jgi:hypothetical protein